MYGIFLPRKYNVLFIDINQHFCFQLKCFCLLAQRLVAPVVAGDQGKCIVFFAGLFYQGIPIGVSVIKKFIAFVKGITDTCFLRIKELKVGGVFKIGFAYLYLVIANIMV